MSIETFIPHEERNVLENVNSDIQKRKKEFFSSIKNEEIKEKVKSYFSFLSEQNSDYFEDNDEWINKFEEDKLNFLNENSDFDEESFDALIWSIINRKYLVVDIESKSKENWDNFDWGDLEWHSKRVTELYNKFIEKQWSYNELLSLPREVRIKLCTKAKVNIEDVMDWEVGSLTFDFKFWKEKINKEIYLNTTAWQLLPAEVQQVIKNGIVYFRSGQLWEFFTENNKRLTIHQNTHITVSKLQSREKVLENRNKTLHDLGIENEEDISLEDSIKLEAKLRWIDPEFAVIAFKEALEKISEDERGYALENMLTEFDRIRGIYRTWSELDSKWKYNNRLALEIFNIYWWKKWKEKAKNYWIDKKYIDNKSSYISTDIEMDKVIDWEITQNTIDRINRIKKFEKWDKDTIILFKIACRVAGINESWAENPHLHKILSNESAWIVGNLNYTIKWMSLWEYKNRALSSNNKNPIWSKSTASGLGQLLLSNIDKFYPNWRKWIWNPIEEAVWFIKYIEDRYWNPDIAISVYWKKWSYINARTWKRQYKNFQEWY